MKIELRSYEEMEKETDPNVLIVSVTGKVRGNYSFIDNYTYIKGLGTFRFYYHEKAKDYLACHYLYLSKLQKKGYNCIMNYFKELNPDGKRLVICDKAGVNEFSYRHIVADFLIKNGNKNIIVDSEELAFQKVIWQNDIYKAEGKPELSKAEVKLYLNGLNWVFAKTMPNNPHFYSIREKAEETTFKKVVDYIRYFGDLNIYNEQVYRVLQIDDFIYWTMPSDIANYNCDLINKKPLLKNKSLNKSEHL